MEETGSRSWLYRLCAGHFLVDTYSSMLGAFLPFLHESLNLTLTQAGLLGGGLILSGSFLQPLYGFLADHVRHKVIFALGPAIAGIFISSLGLAPGFWTLLTLVILGGVGIATFHPQAVTMVSSASQRRQGVHVSLFIASGMIGYACGPIYIGTLLSLIGLQHSYWAALPGVGISIYLLAVGPSPAKKSRQEQDRSLLPDLARHFNLLATLFVLVVLRSAVQLVWVAFLPLLFTLRGHGELVGSQVLSLFLLLGGTASFFGGVLNDRIGGKKVILISHLGFAPLLMLSLQTEGLASMLLTVLGGGFLLLTLPVHVLMAQRTIPQGASTVSALMMGFAWGVGGVAVPLVGVVSDRIGLENALMALLVLTLPAVLVAALLPVAGPAFKATPATSKT